MIDYLILLPKVTYWTYFATIYLIVLTIKDIKTKGWINDRHNWVMLGLSLSLLSHIPTNILYMICIIVVVILTRIYLLKYKILAEGDINALVWLIMGLGIMGYKYILAFYFIFVVTTSIYSLIKWLVFRVKQNTPFFPVILSSFFLTAIILNMY